MPALDVDFRPLDPVDVLKLRKTRIDVRAIALGAMAERPGMLKHILEHLGFLTREEESSVQVAFGKLNDFFRSDALRSEFLHEACRVAELPRQAMLVAIFDQLRRVAEFALSDEASLDQNLDAAEDLIRGGRADLFLP